MHAGSLSVHIQDKRSAVCVITEGFSITSIGGSVGCCPEIVTGPTGSIIEPFTGWRGNVALIVDYGTCKNGDKGFM